MADPQQKPAQKPRRRKRTAYGWPVGRILNGYVQFVNAVHKTHPRGLAKPAQDTVNVPKQCFDLVSNMANHDEALMRKALGKVDPLTDEEFNRYVDFVDELVAWLREHPWEPAEKMEEEPKIVEFVSVTTAEIATGVPDRTIQHWCSVLGMPHQQRGKKFYVQLKVVEKWQSMKFRHKVRRNAKNCRL